MAKYLILSLIALGFICGQTHAQFVYYIPQVVDGTDPHNEERIFATTFSFLNLSTTSIADVVIDLSDDKGGHFPVLRRLNPGLPGGIGTFRERFSLPPNGFIALKTLAGARHISNTGWARIESTGDIGILATVTYRVSVNAEVVTSASVIPEPLTQKFSTFTFNDCREGGTGPKTSTGIALLNPSETESVEVKVRLFNPDGTFRDERTIVLAPRHKIAQFFDEEELFTGLGSFCGSAKISSNLPIAATVIRVDDIYWSTFRTFPPVSE
ncbi:MAG: hypothetical protein ACRD1R_20880 [Acidobacteriota bacterium]